jgi:membrane protease YdiL (CAAX protease family)
VIRQDSYSRMLIIIALGFSLYLATFTPTTIIIFPALLLLSGLVMERFLERKFEAVEDTVTSPSTQREVLKYTLIALVGIFFMGFLVKVTFPLELSGYDIIIYGFVIGVAEEQFFRGFLLDFFLAYLPSAIMALLASAVSFMIFHFGVMGTAYDSLMYVFAGGLILSWVAYKSRRISPSMIAHGGNNVYAALMVIQP